MPGNTPDAPPPAEDDSARNAPDERYSAFEMENGEFVIYDTENTRAWLQSSAVVELAGMS